MARQIKRFGVAVVLVTLVGVAVIAPLAKSYQSAPPGQGDPAIAQAVRHAVGFGAMDVLPALAGDNSHGAMINVALAFVADHEAELAPLVENYNNADEELIRAITRGEGVESARQAVQATRSAVTQAVAGCVSDLSDHVPPPFQALIAVVLQNGQLDPDLKCLDLSTEQRDAIVAAQDARDIVLRNARNWYQTAKNEEAKAAFEDSLQSTLTQPQRAHLASDRQNIQDRLTAMMAAEAEPFNEG